MLDYEMANDFIMYEPFSGLLRWKTRTLEAYTKHGLHHRGVPNLEEWNARNAGEAAFNTPIKGGKRAGHFFGHRIRADAIVWLLHSGKWRSDPIHHVDGDVANSRIDNLSRRHPDKLIRTRKEHGIWPTDTLELIDGIAWAVRNGRDAIRVGRCYSENDLERIARDFDIMGDA